jgi:hypothetical protein
LNLFNFIRDKFYEFKYRKLLYKPTRTGFKKYKDVIAQDFVRDFVMPPASYSQIISLLSIDEIHACGLTITSWSSDYFLSCYWSDFKKHSNFIAWYNSKYNEARNHYFYKYEYNAIIFNPATFYDYCKVCEYASQRYVQTENEKENKRNREVRDNQITNLKELINYIQSLQDKDIDTLTSVLESDKDIASRLTLEASTEKMLEPTHTLSYWRNHHWKEN